MSGYNQITNYILKEDIGEGNFGKVKLAIYKETKEKFAIKILNKEQIRIKMKNTIFQENDIITKFNHINVIFVFAIIEDSDNYYIVMEYCKKGELFDYIVAHQYLSEEESSIFFYQLINGVDYIHSKGIAHRDLKPENLLLTENKILKIIDFGLSHEFNEGHFLLTKCGSPSYASPEIIKGTEYDGFKTDIWCCGIILYAMVCGYLPFEGENNDILFKNIVKCEPEIPDYLSNECQEIIRGILKEDPMERITIDGIKKSKFYLKGKKLCNIDYNFIEKSILRRRHRMRSYDQGEQSKDKNLAKISKTQEKNKNIRMLLDLNESQNDKNELNTKKRNDSQKRHIRFISTKTALNTFRDKINIINKNFNKQIKKFHKNMNLILNTDANAIVNNKINNDPRFNNQVITLTKVHNNSTSIKTVNSTIKYNKSSSYSHNKSHKILNKQNKENKIAITLIKYDKNSEKDNQRKKYENLYNNLSKSNKKKKKNIKEIINKKNIKNIINNDHIYNHNNTNSINIINHINNTINNYGTLNIFTNKSKNKTNKISPKNKNDIQKIKKINANSYNKKEINLNQIKKNIRSVNSSKSNKKENKKNKSNSNCRSYRENKNIIYKNQNFNSNKNKIRNINRIIKTNYNKIFQYPSLKVENNLYLEQKFINRAINNIKLIHENKNYISPPRKKLTKTNILTKVNDSNTTSKSINKSKTSKIRAKSSDKGKMQKRIKSDKIRLYNNMHITTKTNTNNESSNKEKQIINSISGINNRQNSSSNQKINKSSRTLVGKKNINNKLEYKMIQNSIKKKVRKKIYNKKLYSENKSNKFFSISKIFKNINNNINNSKKPNNIKNMNKIVDKRNNKNLKLSIGKSKNSNINQFNIRIIKNFNNFSNYNIKNFFFK